MSRFLCNKGKASCHARGGGHPICGALKLDSRSPITTLEDRLLGNDTRRAFTVGFKPTSIKPLGYSRGLFGFFGPNAHMAGGGSAKMTYRSGRQGRYFDSRNCNRYRQQPVLLNSMLSGAALPPLSIVAYRKESQPCYRR